MNKPLVTVLITTYNSNPHYLRRAVDSALRQDYEGLEVLIVDDGSEVIPSNILGELPRVRFENLQHRGLPHGLRYGMKIASGKYVAILDHDDELTPGSIRSSVDAIQREGVGLVYGDLNFIDEKSAIYTSQKFTDIHSFEEMVRTMFTELTVPMKHCGTLFNRENVIAVGNYREDLQAEFDIHLLLKVAKEFGWYHLNRKVANYRTSKEHTTHNSMYRVKGMQIRSRLIDEFVESLARRIKYKTATYMIMTAKIIFEAMNPHRPQWVFRLSDLVHGRSS
jgi:glycosyltransferase involved in cell wall biosynthesis